jgi:hypothetical protein
LVEVADIAGMPRIQGAVVTFVRHGRPAPLLVAGLLR